jgi:hypothetical protein
MMLAVICAFVSMYSDKEECKLKKKTDKEKFQKFVRV